MRRLFVIACNKGSDIYILTKRGAWVRRDTADDHWWRSHDPAVAKRWMPQCPEWGERARVCTHAFIGVPEAPAAKAGAQA